jgi:type I restriction enzyme, S subunit
MGKVAINVLPVITNQQINSIIPNTNLVCSDFLYYRLVSMYDTLRAYGRSGTAVPIVNKGDFENLTAKIPTLSEQEAITAVLSALDDKIDLLHRQNKTLESMAQALFRHWFIDNVDGSWDEVPLGDVVETTSGGTPSRKKLDYYSQGTILWVKSKELNGSYIFQTEERITEKALNHSSAKILPKNSVLIAMYGATVGEYALLATPATCNQAICALLPNQNYPFTFLFMLAKNNKDKLIKMAVGSAQQNISQRLIKTLPIPAPTPKIRYYHACIMPIFNKLESNIQQIDTLEKLRDTLLPKLMSGEVRVRQN